LGDRPASEAIVEANGKNAVDISNLAVAAVDAALRHHFVGQRFTVGY